MLLGVLQLNLDAGDEVSSMSYCTADDVRKFAPQAEVGFDLTPYITQADGVIDANLRASYDLPLTAPYPQLLIDCAGQLAAGYYLSAHYTKVNQRVPDFARDLLDAGMKCLIDIKTDPSLLGLDMKTPDADDYAQNAIVSSDTSDGNSFDSTDELDWGD